MPTCCWACSLPGLLEHVGIVVALTLTVVAGALTALVATQDRSAAMWAVAAFAGGFLAMHAFELWPGHAPIMDRVMHPQIHAKGVLKPMLARWMIH